MPSQRRNARSTRSEPWRDEVGLAEAAIALEYLEFMRGRVARAHDWTHRALRHGLAAGRRPGIDPGGGGHRLLREHGPAPVRSVRRDGRSAPVLLRRADLGKRRPRARWPSPRSPRVTKPGSSSTNARWRGVVDSRGLSWLGAIHALVIAGVETWIGKPEAAERRLRAARDVLVPLGDIWWIGSLDSALCAAVAAQGESQRFLRLADAFDASPPVPDRQALIRGSLLRSRAFLLRGLAADAEAAARRGVELAEPTDLMSDQADALHHARRRPRCQGPRRRGHSRARERRGPAPGERARGGGRRTRTARRSGILARAVTVSSALPNAPSAQAPETRVLRIRHTVVMPSALGGGGLGRARVRGIRAFPPSSARRRRRPASGRMSARPRRSSSPRGLRSALRA